jgi:hypothetical protein
MWKKLVSGLAVSLLAGAITITGTAGQRVTTTYHGTFSGNVLYEGCSPSPSSSPVANGVWNVALHGDDSATVTVNISVDGRHHVSYGAGATQTAPGPDFSVWLDTGAGRLVISLDDGKMTYRIDQYEYDGIKCAGGVTYLGELR